MRFNRAEALAMLAKVPEDEPIFVLRAQDKAAVRALEAWIDTASALGANKEKLAAAKSIGWAFIDWRKGHMSKVPD